jgi:hypothetical protein
VVTSSLASVTFKTRLAQTAAKSDYLLKFHKIDLGEVHGDSAVALGTIYFWINEFNGGRICIQDEAGSGRPDEVTTMDIIEKIHGIIMETVQ